MPGVHDVCEYLDSQGVPRGLITCVPFLLPLVMPCKMYSSLSNTMHVRNVIEGISACLLLKTVNKLSPKRSLRFRRASP